MKILKKIHAWILTKLRSRKYKKKHRIAKLAALLFELFKNDIKKTEQTNVHPLHEERVKIHRSELTRLINSKDRYKPITICFGDSMFDMSRKWIDDEVPTEHNFAISGSTHRHMLHMAKDLIDLIKLLNVKYIVIGTLGGNSLLTYQDATETLTLSIEVLNYLRNQLQGVKFIVVGMPPVYNIHATLNHMHFDSGLYRWVLEDGNSVFIALQKKYAKDESSIYPKPKLDTSIDGTHFTEFGAVLFCGDIKRGKEAMPGTLI